MSTDSDLEYGFSSDSAKGTTPTKTTKDLGKGASGLKKPLLLFGAGLLLTALVVGLAVPLARRETKSSNNSDNSSSPATDGGTGSNGSTAATTEGTVSSSVTGATTAATTTDEPFKIEVTTASTTEESGEGKLNHVGQHNHLHRLTTHRTHCHFREIALSLKQAT